MSVKFLSCTLYQFFSTRMPPIILPKTVFNIHTYIWGIFGRATFFFFFFFSFFSRFYASRGVILHFRLRDGHQ